MKQPANPVGFPLYGYNPVDYEMDPEVIGETDLFNGTYRESIKDDLKSLPVMSVVMAPEDCLGIGIYDHLGEGLFGKACLHRAFILIQKTDSD